MVPPVNYKCKCGHWCGSKLYVPSEDDVIFKCELCKRSFAVKGKHFEDLFTEALNLAGCGEGAEYLIELDLPWEI